MSGCSTSCPMLPFVVNGQPCSAHAVSNEASMSVAAHAAPRTRNSSGRKSYTATTSVHNVLPLTRNDFGGFGFSDMTASRASGRHQGAGKNERNQLVGPQL